MSYARFNDEHDDGQLSRFRERLAAEVRAQTGREFLIFQDRADIAWGQNWRQRIDETLDAVTLLMVIITPGFFASESCRAEVARFLERERKLGRSDLILPVYYISAREMDNPTARESDELARVLASRQFADWRELRFEPFTSPVARKAVAQMASRMRDAFWHLSPVQAGLVAGGGERVEPVLPWTRSAPVPSRSVRTLIGHGDRVNNAEFSPDGTLLATTSMDKTVRLWEIATGRTIRTLTGHAMSTQDMAFSPDGNLLATASTDGTVRLWEIATGRTIHTLTGHTDQVFRVAFSSNGTLLATAGMDLRIDGRNIPTIGEKTVRLWDISTGQTIHTLTGHAHGVNGVAFSPDGNLLILATTSVDGTVRLWDIVTGQNIRTLTGHTDSANGVAFSPDGNLLATASADGTVRLWDIVAGQNIRTLTGRAPHVYKVAFSPYGTLLAASGDSNIAWLWDIATGEVVSTLTGHANWAKTVAFSPDGTLLATASDDKTARLWA